ncbi:MAG: flgH [Chlamydiales bacterium]|jgi:flagellar basal body L-ring protein FlgH|nr:flgH [Chlamydiales bacterium]
MFHNKWLLAVISSMTLIGAPLSAARPSLYSIKNSPFAADNAANVGDLLTIIVDEFADAKDEGENDSELSSDVLSSTLNNFLLSYIHLDGRLGKAIGNNRAGSADTNKIKGKAKNINKHDFKTELQARVIEVVAPDQLLIRGSRSLNFNGKLKDVFITGIIRKQDISVANSIESKKLADATIEIDGEVVSKDLQPGFFRKLLRKVF